MSAFGPRDLFSTGFYGVVSLALLCGLDLDFFGVDGGQTHPALIDSLVSSTLKAERIINSSLPPSACPSW